MPIHTACIRPSRWPVWRWLFSAAVQQRYRTLFYKTIRHPFGAAVLVFALYIPIYLISISFATSQYSLVVRVDYALNNLRAAALAVGAELGLAGMLVEVLTLAIPSIWGKTEPLKPSPVESSLQLRFFYGIGPLVLVLLLTLMIGDWVVAGDAARNMLGDRLASTARIASESIPFFLEAGQNLILRLADDPRLLTSEKGQLPEVLHQNLTSVPYFRQLYLLDGKGEPLSGYPELSFSRLLPEPRGTGWHPAGVERDLHPGVFHPSLEGRDDRPGIIYRLD